MKMKILAAVAAISFATQAGAATLQTSDFIADVDRTGFMDFEHLPASDTLPPTTTFDGITVTQVLGQDNDIWTTCGSSCFSNPTGLSWFPDAGDFGYTEITLANGSNFENVGLNYGGRGFVEAVYYELLLNNVSVLFGSFLNTDPNDGYIGFSGGGFDTVRLAGPDQNNPFLFYFGDGTSQALPIDNIEISGAMTPIPVPASLPLLALGIGGLGLMARRKRKVS